MLDALNPTPAGSAPQTAPLLTPAAPPALAPPSGPAAVRLFDRGVAPVYANFCEVRRTAEEVILSLGLEENTADGVAVWLQARAVLSPWTAKRLATLLHKTVADHERAFGALELNPQRRIQPAP